MPDDMGDVALHRVPVAFDDADVAVALVDDPGHDHPSVGPRRRAVARGHQPWSDVRICPVGELDLATIGRLRAQTSEALATGPGRVILDLRQTTFIDSSAIHLAVELLERAARTGTQFSIVPGPSGVQRTFEVAGLTGRLPFVDVPRA